MNWFLIILMLKKHGLTYTTLSHIWTKENLFLLIPFQHEIFDVDPRILIKLNRLKTIATWTPLILQLKNLHNFHVIIQALKTNSLCKHYEDINHDHNFQNVSYCMSYKNKNTPCINRCAQIYKLIEAYIYFNPSWSWVNDVVWHTHALRFF